MKAMLVSSDIGKALGLTEDNTLLEVVSSIISIKNNGEMNFNPSTSTTESVTSGFYTGGSLSTVNAWNSKSISYVYAGSVTGSGTVNISSISGYNRVTTNDILLVVTGASAASTTPSGYKFARADGFKPSLSYNSSNGNISVSGLSQRCSTYGC